EAAGAGAHPAAARPPRPGGAHPQRGRLRAVRRSPVPLAAVRRTRALPARGGPGRFLHRTDQLAEGSGTRSVTGATRLARSRERPPHERPLARRRGQLGARGAVIDHGSGADVRVWAGRTTTVTQAAIAVRRAVWALTSEAVHRRWQQRGIPGWAFRASCHAGRARSPSACVIHGADRPDARTGVPNPSGPSAPPGCTAAAARKRNARP